MVFVFMGLEDGHIFIKHIVYTQSIQWVAAAQIWIEFWIDAKYTLCTLSRRQLENLVGPTVGQSDFS